MLTHFESIVGLLSICFGLLTAILGLVWKAASKWSALLNKLDDVIDKVENHIIESTAERVAIDLRLQQIERKKKDAIRNKTRRRQLPSD
jgi:septal ring factor EnvC (AmiA/AmiB activator)